MHLHVNIERANSEKERPSLGGPVMSSCVVIKILKRQYMSIQLIQLESIRYDSFRLSPNTFESAKSK